MKRSLAPILSFLLVATAFAAVQAAGAWESKVDASVLRDAAIGPTDFIVHMAAKADLHGPSEQPTKATKGIAVYSALTTTARDSQAGVVQVLLNAGAPYRSFWIANAVVATGDLELVQALATRSDVQAIYAVGSGRIDEPIDRTADTPSAPESTTLVATVGPSIDYVRADEAWALGYRGQGAVVASADTGVRWTHNALKSQYRGFNSSTGAVSHDYNWHNAAGPNAECPADDSQPCDDNEHGTHTVGTMAGDDGAGNQIGMAPGAKWIACRNMNQGFGVVPTYMDCMQWFIAPTKIDGTGADPTKAPDVVNNSWGCVEVCAPPLLKDMIDASRAAGIFYSVSAGNDNQFFLGLTSICNNIAFPLSIYKSAFTVGATGATNDAIANFSSLGPVADNPSEGVQYRKPDIVAPGVGIRSAVNASDNAYASLSGTSMSSPHVAGLVALIVSANPALRGHVGTIEEIITSTAKPLTTTKGCGLDSSTQVPNNVYGYGRIDALAAVQLAAQIEPPAEHVHSGELLDPAHNAPIPCELVSSLGGVPRSARNMFHVANACGVVGTDIEFQSRRDNTGAVHDYAFLGTMGSGTRIYDITDPQLPRWVGGYADPGWEDDLAVFGDTLVLAFDPIEVAAHLSDCLRAKNPTTGQINGGVDIVRLAFDPALAALKAPLTFQTQRLGCYLNTEGGGAHTVTVHPSGQALFVNTSASGIEVVDLRGDAFTFVRKIPSAIAASAHDVFFSRDGNTMYSAGIGSTRIVDVRDIFNRAPTLIANVPNNPPAAQGGDGHVVQISHQSDTTSDGRLMIVTDEKGGGLSNTSCNQSSTGAIGGAHFWALESLPGVAKSIGATVASPLKIGTWIYPNPTLGVDPLDSTLAGLGRTQRACTIHMYRGGGNGQQSPATLGVGTDGLNGVSGLPVNEIVTAHYGAGVWHMDVMAAPGQLDDPRTTWGRTLGWNVMPGADTWAAKEYKGFVYASDMSRGLDVFRIGTCSGVECVDVLPDATPTPAPTPTLAPTPTPSPSAGPTPSPTPNPTPTDPTGCTPSHVWFQGIVYDANQPEGPREDFVADVRNFEYFLSALRKVYCIPDAQASILAFDNNWTDPQTGKTYAEGSESNLKARLAQVGAQASQYPDSILFFFLSSHGNVWSGLLPNSGCPPERLAGSFSGLKDGGGEDGSLDDCELGNTLNANFAPTTRMFVAVDCSLCGGFSDSLTAASGTIPDDSVPVGAGVVAPNRIVVTGCAMTTECFGSDVASDGAVSYHHMREVLEGTTSCDGWTVPGFPDVEGFDVPVNGPPFRDLDGRCTASEWFFAAVEDAYVSQDVIGIQQQFRIKYRLPSLGDDLLIAGSGPTPTPTPTVGPTPTASPSPTPTLAPTPTPTLAPTPTPVPLADLSVSAMSASEQKAKAGDPVLVSATITNSGPGAAPASRTEFKFSDGTFLGAADTPAIPAGGSATVSVGWNTRGANGDYVITATADTTAIVAESNEGNNLANLSVSIRGNKVQNQSYEQPNSSGTAPESWQSGSTAAGSTSYDSGASSSSDGTRSVSITGTGRSALIYGLPTWTSAPMAVTPGELLTISVDVRSVGLSSAPSLSLAYLGPVGEVLSTVKVLTAPLASTGFTTLSTQFRLPTNVTSLRLVLAGFSATDTNTAGTVTFDNVGVWGE